MPPTLPTPTATTPEAQRDARAGNRAERICRLAEDATRAAQPEAALRTLHELRDELVALERARVAEALREGSSFGAIAKALGISRQAAHRRYRDLAPVAAEPLRTTGPARHALHLARDEAAATRARGVRSEHVLLGVLRAGGRACRALEAEGVTAEAARQCLAATDRRDELPRAASADARRWIVGEAAEIARARRAPCLDVEHLALAALNAPDGGALRAVTALGVPAAALRDRLGC